jgi:O-antigen ligase
MTPIIMDDMKPMSLAPRAGNFVRENFAFLAPGVFLLILPFSGTVALRLSALVIAAVTAAVVWRRTAPPPVPLKLPIALWAAVAALSLAWALDPQYSLREIKNEIGYTLVAFLSFYALTNSERAWRAWNAFFAVGFVAISITAAYHFTQGAYAFSIGRHGGPGSFSTYLILVSPLLFFAIDRSRARSARRSLAWAFAFFVLVIVDGAMTLNRAFWVSLALSIVTFVALRLFRGTDRAQASKLTALISVASLLLAGLLMFASAKWRQYWGLLSQGPLEAPFHDPRMELWSFTIQHIGSHPLVGTGFGIGSAHSVLDAMQLKDPLLWHAHNMFLNYGLEMGIPGILALLLLFLSIGREFLKLCRAPDETCSRLGAAGLAMLVGAVAKSMTDAHLGRNGSLLFWALIGMMLGYGKRLAAHIPVEKSGGGVHHRLDADRLHATR